MMRAFGLLARLRVLRGTRLDPFAYLAERRMERRLITDYESLLERLLPILDGANSALISEIAALPLAIRGFGHVKERNLERALARQEELLMKLEAPASVVRIRAA